MRRTAIGPAVNRTCVKLANAAMRMARPRAASMQGATEVAPTTLVRYLASKGAEPLLRGAVRFPVRLLQGRPVLVGRGTQILFASQLSTGMAVSIGAHSSLNCFGVGGIDLGDRVTIREGAWIQVSSSPYRQGSYLSVGDETYIGPNVVIGAGAPVSIGSRVQIGAGVAITGEEHAFRSGVTVFEQAVKRSGIMIGDDAWIGNGVIILDGAVVGPRAVIGAGAVVRGIVGADEVAVGVPARVIGNRHSGHKS